MSWRLAATRAPAWRVAPASVARHAGAGATASSRGGGGDARAPPRRAVWRDADKHKPFKPLSGRSGKGAEGNVRTPIVPIHKVPRGDNWLHDNNDWHNPTMNEDGFIEHTGNVWGRMFSPSQHGDDGRGNLTPPEHSVLLRGLPRLSDLEGDAATELQGAITELCLSRGCAVPRRITCRARGRAVLEFEDDDAADAATAALRGAALPSSLADAAAATAPPRPSAAAADDDIATAAEGGGDAAAAAAATEEGEASESGDGDNAAEEASPAAQKKMEKHKERGQRGGPFEDGLVRAIRLKVGLHTTLNAARAPLSISQPILPVFPNEPDDQDLASFARFDEISDDDRPADDADIGILDDLDRRLRMQPRVPTPEEVVEFTRRDVYGELGRGGWVPRKLHPIDAEIAAAPEYDINDPERVPPYLRGAVELGFKPPLPGEEKDPGAPWDSDEPVGEWAETIVSVGRTQKVVKGGVQVSFRALVVVGNLNGAGGFGVGKGKSALDAMKFASTYAKRNLYYVDRYRDVALVHDLEGKHNNTFVRIIAVPPGTGGTAGSTVSLILQQMGVSNFSAKIHGRRNPYSVVRAVFAALQTHQSIEQIARKRGRRILEIERQVDREKRMEPKYQYH